MVDPNSLAQELSFLCRSEAAIAEFEEQLDEELNGIYRWEPGVCRVKSG